MWALSLFTVVLHCSAGAGEGAAKASAVGSLPERPARSSSRDIKIPRVLVKRLEDEYRAFLIKSEVSPKAELRRRLLNISAEFTQKNSAALQEEERVVTPTGGGVIDLADVVTPIRGGFNMKILAQRDDGSDAPTVRLFYISNAKSRKIDGENYGAGCGKYMELTKYFTKTAGPSGFQLYSANQRYLSVIGGTFVAVQFDKEALSVASLTFTDSRYPALLCE